MRRLDKPNPPMWLVTSQQDGAVLPSWDYPLCPASLSCQAGVSSGRNLHFLTVCSDRCSLQNFEEQVFWKTLKYFDATAPLKKLKHN